MKILLHFKFLCIKLQYFKQNYLQILTSTVINLTLRLQYIIYFYSVRLQSESFLSNPIFFHCFRLSKKYEKLQSYFSTSLLYIYITK